MHEHPVHRRAPHLAWLIAGALLLRGLIPAGFMLGGAGDAAAGRWLVPCPAQSPELAQMLAGQGQSHHAHHHHGGDAGAVPADAGPSDSCPFAIAVTSAPPMDVPAAVRVRAPAQVFRSARPARLRAGLRLGPPARGPPRHS